MKALLLLYVAFAASAAAAESRRLGASKKSDHAYIFIGGSHYSGANLIEKILSSQYLSSGFRTEWSSSPSSASCLVPALSADTPGMCHAPENEGIFLTRTFSNYYLKQAKPSCLTQSALYWGECASHKRLTKADVKRAGGSNFRNKLLEDWGGWWNMSKPYLVEKDVSNMVKGPFLQQLFGADVTAFVFVLRHPLHACRDLKCDVEKTVNAWLLLHEMMMEDLPSLQHAIVLQFEYMYLNPAPILSAIKTVVGWDAIEVIDRTGDKPNRTEFAHVMKNSSRHTQHIQRQRMKRQDERKSWAPPKARPVELAARANKSTATPSDASAQSSTWGGSRERSSGTKAQHPQDATGNSPSSGVKGAASSRDKRVGGSVGGGATPGAARPRTNAGVVNAGRGQTPRGVSRKRPPDRDTNAAAARRPIRLPSRSAAGGSARGPRSRHLRSVTKKDIETSAFSNNGGWGGWLFSSSNKKPRPTALSRDMHVPVAVIEEPYDVFAWKNSYADMLTKHDKILEKLKQFEARLGKFCYSIYTLEPKPYLCKVEGNSELSGLRGKGVYSVSKNPSLELTDRNKFYEIKTNFTAFGAREKLMYGHLRKRYIVRKKMNETEAIARNQAIFKHEGTSKRFSHVISPEEFAKTQRNNTATPKKKPKTGNKLMDKAFP